MAPLCCFRPIGKRIIRFLLNPADKLVCTLVCAFGDSLSLPEFARPKNDT